MDSLCSFHQQTNLQTIKMNHKSIKVVLLTGGNLGDVRKTLTDIKAVIEEKIGKIEAASSLYESVAWGFESDYPFLNQALVLHTTLSARTLLKTIWEIESSYGKNIEAYFDATGRKIKSEKKLDASPHYESRIIDIDILFYGDEIIEDNYLSIPHPLLPYRKFVLEPLNEIIPHYRHPILGKTIHELYASL